MFRLGFSGGAKIGLLLWEINEFGFFFKGGKGRNGEEKILFFCNGRKIVLVLNREKKGLLEGWKNRVKEDDFFGRGIDLVFF